MQRFRETLARSPSVVGPGRPVPPAGSSGYFDYRHVLDGKKFSRRPVGPFRLGRAIAPARHKAKWPVGLTEGEVSRHVAVVGPSGSGKTFGVMVPWMVAALQTGASVVAIDVKGDLHDAVGTYRQRFGPLGCAAVTLDYTRPARSKSWNWVEPLRHGVGAPDDRAISGAVEAILGKPNPNDNQPFFHQQDSLILQSLLDLTTYSPRSGVTVGDLVALLTDQLRLESVVAKYPESRGSGQLQPYLVTSPGDYASDERRASCAERALSG